MKVFIAADHGGYSRKDVVLSMLHTEGYDVHDCSAPVVTPGDDYPHYANLVAGHVRATEGSVGILLCRSGEGMAMAANRHKGIRAAILWNTTIATETRQDNNANIAIIPADFLSEAETIACIRQFLSTSFSQEERHSRRILQLDKEGV